MANQEFILYRNELLESIYDIENEVTKSDILENKQISSAYEEYREEVENRWD